MLYQFHHLSAYRKGALSVSCPLMMEQRPSRFWSWQDNHFITKTPLQCAYVQCQPSYDAIKVQTQAPLPQRKYMYPTHVRPQAPLGRPMTTHDGPTQLLRRLCNIYVRHPIAKPHAIPATPTIDQKANPAAAQTQPLTLTSST